MSENNYLKQMLQKHGVLIASHRGLNGGYIAQNTILAYKNALRHGAHILEIDVIRSSDGIFYAFHNGLEKTVLGFDKDIREATSTEIETLYISGSNATPTHYKLERLDDVLAFVKETPDCLINIDRSWFYWEDIIEYINEAAMASQIIIKSPVDKTLLTTLKEKGPSIMYMPITKSVTDVEIVKAMALNTVAFEMIVAKDTDTLADKAYLSSLKAEGYSLWINTITLDDKTILSAHRDDNRAIETGDYEAVWGHFIDLGFDMIQTDWPALIQNFIKNR
ncbi:glycerophosphodiester phosphodiesterase family protein [Erysipelothrix aquatica]|uniref:glycerophosphodiester phosphodiesterase family protein n=1 Tax=Erysipelothrix aquatica TaxID=2683714 RepID=UPI00135925B9|nr:glycerophosphodiester phosphodiesterase family protein [Erysipelothrix aquatica]